MKKFLPVITAVILCLGLWTAAKSGDIHKVSADLYSAEFDTSGVFTRFDVAGYDFLSHYGDYTGGGFLTEDMTAAKAESTEFEKDTVKAVYPQGVVTYNFVHTGVNITAENRSDKPVTYALYPQAKAVRFSDGRYAKVPVRNDTFTRAAVFGEGAWHIVIDGLRVTRLRNNTETEIALRRLKPGEKAEIKIEIREASSPELEWVNTVTGGEAMGPIRLTSPMPYQVFQRMSKEKGKVSVVGSVAGSFGGMTATVEGKGFRKKVDVPINRQCCFATNIDVPAGGWYTVTLSAEYDDGTPVRKVIDHVGVGEVFVIAGQSNASGFGEKQIVQTSKMVSSFNGSFWCLADDPQLGSHDMSEGGSFHPAFGDALYEKIKVPIGIVPVGHGGSFVYWWLPNADYTNVPKEQLYRGPLFDYMIERMLKTDFRMVLWHQGESDRGCDIDATYAEMCRIIESSRKAAERPIPWMVAKVSKMDPNGPEDPNIRAVQQRHVDNGYALEGPDTDKLTGDYRALGGTDPHFSPKGLREHGRLWAEAVAKYLNSIL